MTPTETTERAAAAEGATGPPGSSATAAAGREKSPDEIADVYAEKADTVERWAFLEHLLMGRYRRRHFGDVSGRVLDVACGAGSNVRYLPDGVDLTGVDISPAMLELAEGELAEYGIDGTVREMDAQDLAFEADSFDAVISALSTCTFPDPVAALDEMARVCAPDGTVRLLEHGQSSVGPIAKLLAWRADAHYEEMGCRLTQEPVAHVEASNLRVESVDRSFFGILTSIEARPESGG